MNKKEFLESIRKQIHFAFDRDSIEQEINHHIEDSIFDLMEDGLSQEEAERIAVEQMGDPIETGKLLNKEHHPLLGYLWIISKAMLYVLLIPALTMIVSFAYNIYQLSTPVTVEKCKTMIHLDIEIDIDTHLIKLDNICIDDKGQYMITYRSWQDYSYSRLSRNDYFDVENEIGEFWSNSGRESHGFFGSIGYKEFKWPENDVLNIQTATGEIISINLKEYDYEKKE